MRSHLVVCEKGIVILVNAKVDNVPPVTASAADNDDDDDDDDDGKNEDDLT